jgi:hypothetical protein
MAVKCEAHGCRRNAKVLWKGDPADPDTWAYLRCDRCLSDVCAAHGEADDGGNVLCGDCYQAECILKSP